MANPLLFQPYRLRSTEFRNRVWAAPMCQWSIEEHDGIPRDWHLEHIGSLARGGVGLVLVEAAAVLPEGRISLRDLGIWTDEQGRAYERIVAEVHAHGAKIGIQLAHSGRKAATQPDLPGYPAGQLSAQDGAWQAVAPSPIAFGELAVPRELGTDGIREIIEAFTAAAVRAAGAGFDAVEVHAAHGYLLNEFLSPLSNQRTDEYGGDLEGRSRLLRQIVRSIRAELSEIPILVRVSGTDWEPDGFGIDEIVELSYGLAEDGVDLIDVSSGGILSNSRIPVGPGYQVPLASGIRAGALPVGAVGFITGATQAETILMTGQADVILLGRPLLSDPHLPIRWARELRLPDWESLIPQQYFRAKTFF